MRILLGIDGNDTGRLVRDLAALLSLKESEVLLVHVQDTGVRGEMELIRRRFPGRGLPADRMDRMSAAERARVDEILHEGEQAVQGLARAVKVHADAGEPGRLLASIAADRGVGLIVVGARSGTGTVPAGPKSLGHTARFLVDHSPCPVLLIRHSGDAAAKGD